MDKLKPTIPLNEIPHEGEKFTFSSNTHAYLVEAFKDLVDSNHLEIEVQIIPMENGRLDRHDRHATFHPGNLRRLSRYDLTWNFTRIISIIVEQVESKLLCKNVRWRRLKIQNASDLLVELFDAFVAFVRRRKNDGGACFSNF